MVICGFVRTVPYTSSRLPAALVNSPWNWLARVRPDGSVDGVDAAPEMVAQAQRSTAGAGLPLHFQTAPAQRLPFDDNIFDGVSCTLALHHIAAEDRPLAILRWSGCCNRAGVSSSPTPRCDLAGPKSADAPTASARGRRADPRQRRRPHAHRRTRRHQLRQHDLNLDRSGARHQNSIGLSVLQLPRCSLGVVPERRAVLDALLNARTVAALPPGVVRS